MSSPERNSYINPAHQLSNKQNTETSVNDERNRDLRTICFTGGQVTLPSWLFLGFVIYFIISAVALIALSSVCAFKITSIDSKVKNINNEVKDLDQIVRETREDYLTSQSATTLKKVRLWQNF